MFIHNTTCIGKKLKDLKAQLDRVMHFSSYGPLMFALKSAQNAKFAVNHNQLKFDNGLGDRFNSEQLYG